MAQAGCHDAFSEGQATADLPASTEGQPKDTIITNAQAHADSATPGPEAGIAAAQKGVAKGGKEKSPDPYRDQNGPVLPGFLRPGGCCGFILCIQHTALSWHGKTATQALVSMAGARATRQPHCTAFVMELQRQCLLALKRLPFVSNHYAWAPHAPRCPPRSLPNDHALRCPRLSELTSADVMQGATPTLSCCQTSRRCAPSLP